MSEAPIAAAERIRDAAIIRFGTEGFGVGLRAIAAEAGVTAGLIIHHFGSKDGLRKVCDDHVRELLWSHKRPMANAFSLSEIGPEEMAELTPALRYLLRSFQVGGDFAVATMNQLVADTESYLAEGVEEGLLHPSIDPAGRAKFLAYQSVGGMLVWHLLHADPANPDFSGEVSAYMKAMTPASLEMFAQGLFVDRSMLDEYLLYVPDPPVEGSARA